MNLIWLNFYCMMASLWSVNYHWLILNHFKVNLEMNSSRVLSTEEGSTFAIVNFYLRHRSHLIVIKFFEIFFHQSDKNICLFVNLEMNSSRALSSEEGSTFAIVNFCQTQIALDCYKVLWNFFHQSDKNICLFVEEFKAFII